MRASIRRVLIPLRTDAPVHHRPWATMGIIATNVAVTIWTFGADAADVRRLALEYGRWAPWQWVTSVFLHAGLFHLVGNMIYLWVFGLVVEGKIGWRRFLALYGVIAVVSNMIEQTLLLGAHGGSLGASGVIFGLIAVAMVWAPENEVECLFVFLPSPREIDISIRDLGIVYVLIEAFWALLGGFTIRSEMLHLLGFAVGLPIGVAMVRRGWVDCEGWDWFSRRDYRAAPIGSATRRAEERAPEAARPRPPARPVAERFDGLVTAGDIDGALRLHAACSVVERSLLPTARRERLVDALVDADRAADARPVVEGLLRDDPGHPRMGLLEARTLVTERRLAKAERILSAISGRLEDDAQRKAHADVAAQAVALHAAGALEFDE